MSSIVEFKNLPGSDDENFVAYESLMIEDEVSSGPSLEEKAQELLAEVELKAEEILAKAKEEGNYDEVYNFYLNILKEQFSVFTFAKSFTHLYTVHEIIDPRDTRPRIIKALRASANKHETFPEKRHWVKPV